MKTVVLVLALVVGLVACGTDEPQRVFWTTQCEMRCGEASILSNAGTECELQDTNAYAFAQSLNDMCVSILLDEGCAVVDASCDCQAIRTEMECN